MSKFVKTHHNEDDTESIAYHLSKIREKFAHRPLSSKAVIPVSDLKLHQFYLELANTFWTAGEHSVVDDKITFDDLNSDEQHLLIKILAFFAASDGLVYDIVDTIKAELGPDNDVAMLCNLQIANETIHAHVYGDSLSTFLDDPKYRMMAIRAADEDPTIQAKDEWMDAYNGASIPIEYKIVALIASEGIAFMSSFIGVYYFKSTGRLGNFVEINAAVNTDEELHRNAWIYVLNNIESILKRIHGEDYSYDFVLEPSKTGEILREMVELEINYINDILPTPLRDFNAESMINYAKVLANDIYALIHPSVPPLYVEADRKIVPSWFSLGLDTKGNIHEKAIVADYAAHSTADQMSKSAVEINEDKHRAYTDASAVDF